ncbi:MAG: hypothetical protein IT460_09685 [Planctomycetes bacterium]|nr:hypothetical protein [Planctomycetota bacterium]
MAVSAPVRSHYARRIFAETGRDRLPRNFRPLEAPATGRSTVEGCAGGGKNILELSVLGDGDRIVDVRAACGLCNPAMYVAADLVCEWARGLGVAEVLALDPLAPATLAPLFAALGASPDDAREKLQYALLALGNALRAHRGERPAPLPRVAPPSDGAGPDPE